MKQFSSNATLRMAIQFFTRFTHRSFSVGGSLFQLPTCPPKRQWRRNVNAKACGVLGLLMFAFTVANAQQQQAPPQPPLPQQQGNGTQFPASSAFANSNLTYKIIDAPNNTFCYDVYADGRLMIHQSSVPGLPGNEGFKSKEDAEKVALLVMDKIKKGEMPPTVSIDEMKQLGVIPLH